ncbi:hypothetical protein B9Z19DRAFT_1067901 [Tuber borchii]|uniref:Uncharacterized protein n=1 Tax=Tuber borchii TaxID=42251 RepID=A0A2T6ZH76_TUBBO|nr:hypothetical protein B9Z19DRAFT_1067901 [Tuber borchii]
MEGRNMEVAKYPDDRPDTVRPETPPEQPQILLPPFQPAPPPPPFHPGQWWFSNKIHTRLTPLQHSLLSTRPSPIPPSPHPNKCRKLRPWLILSLLPNNKALVICSTTRENRGSTGLTSAQARSFLPIAPTPEFCGREQVRVVLDERRVFVGRSLVFLEVVKVVCVGVLGEFIGWVGIEGEEGREGLERVLEGRREWGLGVERNGGDVDGRYSDRGGGERRRDREKGRGRGSWRDRGGMGSANGWSGACTDGVAYQRSSLLQAVPAESRPPSEGGGVLVRAIGVGKQVQGLVLTLTTEIFDCKSCDRSPDVHVPPPPYVVIA